jgi:hypothetical protein
VFEGVREMKPESIKKCLIEGYKQLLEKVESESLNPEVDAKRDLCETEKKIESL